MRITAYAPTNESHAGGDQEEVGLVGHSGPGGSTASGVGMKNVSGIMGGRRQ